MIRYASLAAVFTILFGSLAFSIATQDKKPTQDKKTAKDKKSVLPKQDPDTVIRRDFMRTKLMYTKNIFEGLTTDDFKMIERSTKEVQNITAGEHWIAVDNDTYRKLTEEFKTAADRLMKAAKTKNLDATALRFYQLSTSCIDCHKHLRLADYDL